MVCESNPSFWGDVIDFPMSTDGSRIGTLLKIKIPTSIQLSYYLPHLDSMWFNTFGTNQYYRIAGL